MLRVIFFGLIIGGLVLNTIFLVREIRRNEQHDSFINAVTHELKTPIASIRLYLETLQRRDVDENSARSSTISCSPTVIVSCIQSSRSYEPAAPASPPPQPVCNDRNG